MSTTSNEGGGVTAPPPVRPGAPPLPSAVTALTGEALQAAVPVPVAPPAPTPGAPLAALLLLLALAPLVADDCAWLGACAASQLPVNAPSRRMPAVAQEHTTT